MDNDECVICLKKYIQGDVVATIKSCRHIFHRDCIMAWTDGWVLLYSFVHFHKIKWKSVEINHSKIIIFSSKVNPTCPLCRESCWYTRNCIVCGRDFHTSFSVQIKCDICCAAQNFIDAVRDHYWSPRNALIQLNSINNLTQ